MCPTIAPWLPMVCHMSCLRMCHLLQSVGTKSWSNPWVGPFLLRAQLLHQACTMDEVCEAFRAWGRASRVASSQEHSVTAKLVETLKRFNYHQCETFVKENEAQALLYSYSFDCTTSKVTHKVQQTHASGPIVRAGRQSLELLMQRLILRVPVSNDSSSIQHLFAEPKPMSNGKSAWYIFDAACGFFPLPRSLGHTGLTVYHVVADRAQLSSVAKLLQARQEGFYRDAGEGQLSPEKPSPFLHLRDVFVTSGCSLHDLQNALQWSVQDGGLDFWGLLRLGMRLQCLGILCWGCLPPPLRDLDADAGKARKRGLTGFTSSL